jgi:hypothetical protein
LRLSETESSLGRNFDHIFNEKRLLAANGEPRKSSFINEKNSIKLIFMRKYRHE